MVEANFPRDATNQKHYPELAGGARFSDVISSRNRRETSGAGGVAKCPPFSQNVVLSCSGAFLDLQHGILFLPHD